MSNSKVVLNKENVQEILKDFICLRMGISPDSVLHTETNYNDEFILEFKLANTEAKEEE